MKRILLCCISTVIRSWKNSLTIVKYSLTVLEYNRYNRQTIYTAMHYLLQHVYLHHSSLYKQDLIFIKFVSH